MHFIFKNNAECNLRKYLNLERFFKCVYLFTFTADQIAGFSVSKIPYKEEYSCYLYYIFIEIYILYIKILLRTDYK